MIPGEHSAPGWFHHKVVKVGDGVAIVNDNITERKLGENALRESEQRYRRVVQDQLDFLVRWRPEDGMRTFVNQSYCQHFGRTEAELLRSSIFEMVPPEEYEANRQIILDALKHTTPEAPLVDGEYQRQDDEGNLRIYHWRDRAVFDDEGNVVEVQSVGRDITEIKAAQAALIENEMLKRALENEQELADLQSQFMTTISHELRTPLQGIATSAGLLDKYWHKLGDERRTDNIQAIEVQVRHLEDLLNKVSLGMRAEHGFLDFQPSQIDPCWNSATMRWTKFDPYCPRITISCSGNQGDVAAIHQDASKLSHILSNLLSNAIKYSPDGGDILLEVSRKGEAVILHVEDHGIGIPEAEMDRLFTALSACQQRRRDSWHGPGLIDCEQHGLGVWRHDLGTEYRGPGHDLHSDDADALPGANRLITRRLFCRGGVPQFRSCAAPWAQNVRPRILIPARLPRPSWRSPARSRATPS